MRYNSELEISGTLGCLVSGWVSGVFSGWVGGICMWLMGGIWELGVLGLMGWREGRMPGGSVAKLGSDGVDVVGGSMQRSPPGRGGMSGDGGLSGQVCVPDIAE